MSHSTFRKWLQNRQKVPPFSTLLRLRQIHQENNMEISIYSVKAIIDGILDNPELKELDLISALNFGIFTLTIYLHNQYFPILEETNIEQLCHAYEQFESEPNTWYTYESILARLSAPLGIKSKIQKSKCPVCLESLGWHQPFLKCGHVYHENCMPVNSCYVCKS